MDILFYISEHKAILQLRSVWVLFTPDLSFPGSAMVSASPLLIYFLKGQVEPLVPLRICSTEPLSSE